MEANNHQKPAVSVELFLCGNCLPTFSPLLQQGVMVPLDSETILSSFLYQNLNLSLDFVEHHLTTVFLNGKPVDDLDQAILRSGDTLALSAAMPGLVGATMRRKGLIASFRSSISHRPEEHRGRGTKFAILTLKLFNLMIEAVGPALLGNGVFLTRRDWEEFLRIKGLKLWDICRTVSVDGQEIQPAKEKLVSWGKSDLINLKITCSPDS